MISHLRGANGEDVLTMEAYVIILRFQDQKQECCSELFPVSAVRCAIPT